MKIPEGTNLIDFTNNYLNINKKDNDEITKAQIADEIGVSRTLVSRYLKKCLPQSHRL